jgi:hypothetical protein
MGSINGLGDVERRKISPLLGLELRPFALEPIASRYIDCAIPAIYIYIM